MKEKLSILVKKLLNRETVSYLIFGVLTTVINIVSFWFAQRELKFIMPDNAAALTANIIAWILSVAFAFITNKIFVFKSRIMKPGIVFRELSQFVIARLCSLAFDEGFMFFAIFFMDSMLAKIIGSVFVVIINYVLSKFFIFRKK